MPCGTPICTSCQHQANCPPPPGPKQTNILHALRFGLMNRTPPPQAKRLSHSRGGTLPYIISPPPPLVVPHPLSFPRGGVASLGQPQIFRCGSLCCCVGDCVVGHCHLYPLHSWQDILLTFAEMELDSTTMFPSWDKCDVHPLHGGTCFGAGRWTFGAR